MHKAFILLIFWIITALLILRILHSRQCVFWSVLSRHPFPGLHDHHDYYCSLIRFLPLLASSYPQAAWAAVFELRVLEFVPYRPLPRRHNFSVLCGYPLLDHFFLHFHLLFHFSTILIPFFFLLSGLLSLALPIRWP